MYASRVACCPLVSHVEYAPCSITARKKGTDIQTEGRRDGRQTVALRLPLDATSVIIIIIIIIIIINAKIK